MRAHVFQHAAFEGIGNIQDWLDTRDATISYTHFTESPDLPNIDGLDLLVVMGGPMSATDEAGFPWLADERRFIASAVEHGIPVLAICLGSQLLASALGASVHRAERSEIGWFPVTALPTDADVFRLPEQALSFHWHSDTFEIPDGAVHLARSAACPNQAFQFGRRAIGLQCHFEMTPEIIESLLERFGDALVPETFVQTAEELRAQPAETFQQMAAQMADILGYLTA